MLMGFELSSMLLDALKTSIKSMIKSVATIKLNKALFVDKNASPWKAVYQVHIYL